MIRATDQTGWLYFDDNVVHRLDKPDQVIEDYNNSVYVLFYEREKLLCQSIEQKLSKSITMLSLKDECSN